jgi:hypothetical protein
MWFSVRTDIFMIDAGDRVLVVARYPQNQGPNAIRQG